MPTQYYSWFQKAVIIAVVILAAGAAHAGPEAELAVRKPQSKKKATLPGKVQTCADKRPWYCGVSTEDRARAFEIYAQANQLFDEAFFSAAVTKYRAALEYWDHPGIHYNLMLALVALEQPIEAHQSSIAALRYGDRALKPEEYRRALDYQKLLQGRISTLEVTCDEPGAVVSMNGKEILHGPGTVRTSILPGQYELVARKKGYLTTHHVLMAVPEKPLKVNLRLLPQEMAMLPTRRWSTWKPWAVVGAGIGVGVAGGLLEWRADVNNRLFRTSFAEECKVSNPGCFADGRGYAPEMKSQQARYTWYRRLGHGASVAGGMAILGGVVLLYLNREQQIDNPERQDLVRISVGPSVTPDAQGLVVNGSF